MKHGLTLSFSTKKNQQKPKFVDFTTYIKTGGEYRRIGLYIVILEKMQSDSIHPQLVMNG